jgi:hypothetical protein
MAGERIASVLFFAVVSQEVGASALHQCNSPEGSGLPHEVSLLGASM